ncbi:hypothetical protein [Oribacterium sp. NK2B42]|uniref:hypothetical protein n=1 Tax=Oribacterium sp. NK2B42 TaxID=689781 RepID=UPI00040AD979|nr:hypothetical protein [Oribacterium sp. NK2B42]
MIKAELIYNPYLLDTEVRFNGNPPRINSLVEKYQKEKLQTWVNKIPSIFYDEMNGYNFELDFTGTEMDYEELKKSFLQAGVGKDLVQLFHKGSLDSRQEKSHSIDELLKWLDDTPNRKFDLHSFRDHNKELFDSAYSFVVIGGSVNPDRIFADIDISVENVESVDELRKTDLHSTPVLFYIDRKTASTLQYNLLELLKRDDITQDQLFFMISPALGEKAEREIRDLGVKKPQVVTSVDDPLIFRYFELFPESEYIYDSINVFQKQADELGAILKEENRQSEITNRDIHEKIKELDNILTNLKISNDHFYNRENLDLPLDLIRAKSYLIDNINQWKIKKTKITDVAEARSLAYEFESEVFRFFDDFKHAVNQFYFIQCATLMTLCDEWYKGAQYKEDFNVKEIVASELSEHSIHRIADELMDIKEEQYVIPKDDFFGKLFKTSEASIQEPVLETIYYYENWRSHAANVVGPVADDMINEAYYNLQKYFSELSDCYMKHIAILIQEVTEEKELVSSQLTEDEKLLQADNDWHTAFCDKLRDIERS